jgi:succinate dehydrogenase/fumarate reductase flavoprotein subunit
MEPHNDLRADVLVIGGGIAGAFAAIKAREGGADVVLVDKAYYGRAGVSALASGVYQTYMPEDDLESWMRGVSTNPLVNGALAKKAILRTYDLLMEMDLWGVKWVKEGGKIVREFSGGSGLSFKTNAMMAEGGPQMMMALRNETLRRGVKVVSRVMVTDLVTSDGLHPTEDRVVGAVGFHVRTGEPWVFSAKATVVSAGPYRFPYPPLAKGFQGMPVDASADGIAMMFRAGAALGKLEFGGGGPHPHEFHCAPGLEMLGGLGCRFVNDRGEDILSTGGRKGRYSHEAVTQARRSVLGNALVREAAAGRQVYLDATHFTHEQHRLVKQVVPIVIHTFERAGYDLSKDVVPYHSTRPATSGVAGGGARINGQCETTVRGLYAAGNCTDGAYISMGQALPGCSVLGAWAGENAALYARGEDRVEVDPAQVDRLQKKALAPLSFDYEVGYERVHGKLVRLLTEVVGCVLNGRNLEEAIGIVQKVQTEELPHLAARDLHDLAKVNGLKNFAEVLEPALRVLLRRKESRGNILREDYPDTDNIEWAKFTVSARESGGIKIWEEPIPEDKDHLPVQATKTQHPFFKEA